jgi:hypothetical protein
MNVESIVTSKVLLSLSHAVLTIFLASKTPLDKTKVTREKQLLN